MPVASPRGVRFGLVALSLALGSCASPQKTAGSPPSKSHAPERVVLLRAEKQATGRWKARAVPEVLTIRGYDPEKPQAVVIWAYRHRSTKITFADPRLQAALKPCDDAIGECTLVLPRGLEVGKQYKYAVGGKFSDSEDLDDNDPFIEVDR